jgi:hypothetical protein
MKVPLIVAASAILSLASTATLAADANSPPPAADAKTPLPVAPPRPYTEDDCQEMNAQLDDSIASSNLEVAFAEKIRRQRSGADESCNSGDYAAGARQLRRILDEVIEARTSPAAETKTSPPAAETKTPPPAPETKTPPPAAETKTPPPAAPPRPYTEDDCQEMNTQLDDSIKSSNLDAAFAEKIRRQRSGADQSCNSGDYAAGARQLRRILDEVIEARTHPAADAKNPPPVADTKAPPPAAETKTPPPAAETKTPPPAAETKTPPPAAPPRPYTEDDCQEMNAQLDDSIESSNLDAKFAEKIRRQRTGADESCNSGDYAAGARQLRRILDEVIEERSKAGG